MKPQPPAMQWGLFLSSVMGVVLSTQPVCDLTVNVALKGVATQSSQYNNFSAACKAIDGNKNPNPDNDQSCAHTKEETAPWWRVDLLDEYRVTTVSITNRNRHAERLDGAEIGISNSLDNNGSNHHRCAVNIRIPEGKTSTFHCNNTEGRYVSVVLPGNKKILTLCEVEISGTLADKLTLVRENKTWKDAQDYCRENHVDLVSVHDEDIQSWVVARAKTASTAHVWLGLRYSRTLGIWFWVSAQSSCYQNWAQGIGTGGEKGGNTGAVQKGGDHLWVSLPETEELNFICSNSEDF